MKKSELENHELIMVAFGKSQPFQVFTKDENGTVFMFDMNDQFIFRKRNFVCSGVGFRNNELYLEGGFTYWLADGYSVKYKAGMVRLHGLPEKFNSIDKIFQEFENVQ